MSRSAFKRVVYPSKDTGIYFTLMEYVRIIVAALLIAGFIRTFIVSPYKIPSGSMVPTLLIGDFLFVSKYAYGTDIPFTDIRLNEKQPKRGDIVVFRKQIGTAPMTNYIKRIVAIPGDTIGWKNEQLLINNQALPVETLSQTYTYQDHGRTYTGKLLQENLLGIQHLILDQDRSVPDLPSITVPEGKYILLGDNRDSSFDARLWDYPSWGLVDRSEIVGRAEFIFWSWNDYFAPRFERLFTSLRPRTAVIEVADVAEGA